MERTRTPSPNRARKLEKGAFSSISTTGLQKCNQEERRKVTSGIRSVIRTSPNARTSRNIVQSPHQTQRKEDLITPEVAKLQESFRNVQGQLARERRQNQKMQAEMIDLRQNMQNQKEQSDQEIDKLTQMLQKIRQGQRQMALDREKFSKEVSQLNAQNIAYKGHIENLGEVLIDLVFSLAKDAQPDDNSYIQQVYGILKEKLQAIGNDTGIDFQTLLEEKEFEMRRYKTPLKRTKSTVLKTVNQDFIYQTVPNKSLKKEEDYSQSENRYSSFQGQRFNQQNDVLYDVEYYTDDSPCSKNSRDFTPPKKTGRHFESFSEYTDPHTYAIALFDFNGEQDDDLQFQRGSIIEVIEKDNTG